MHRLIPLILILAIRAASGQSLNFLKMQPWAIVPGQTTSLSLQVQAAGGPTRVTFESALQPGVETDMKDDGTGGDVVAGDSTYTIVVPAQPIVNAMQPDDVYRPFIGYVRLYKGTAVQGRFNIFAEVADPKIPKLPVTTDASDVQHTDYLVNILMPQAFPLGTSSAIPGQQPIARRFFQFFGDNFDVLNIVYIPEFFQNRFHYSVRNAVKGIGSSLLDIGSQYGSASRLLGISVFPIAGYFDGVDTGVQHEFGHQWINYLNVAPLNSGIPHWPFSTMATGIMGFSIPPTNEGGEFPCTIVQDSSGVKLVAQPNAPVFNDLELYLMGLLPPEQVADQLVLDRQDQGVLSLCNGSPYSGTVTKVRLSDLTSNAAIGPRVPASAAAQKDFRLATILVTRDALLTADEMALYSFFAQRMEYQKTTPIHQGFTKRTGAPFAISARGLGTMTGRIAGSASMNLTPAQMQFAYTQGSAVPNAQTFAVSSATGGALTWSAAVDVPWLTLSSNVGTAPAQITVAVAPQSLTPSTYTGKITVSGAGTAAQTILVTLTVSPKPGAVTVTSVVQGATFQPGISSACWITINGFNLSQTTRLWQDSDFKNGNLPASLDGVSVTVNGLPAFVYYISSTQINALAPDDPTIGTVQVIVKNGIGTSNAGTADKRALSPGFFAFDGKNLAAVHAVGGLIGPPNLISGATTTPAQPGETVLLFGAGFGLTNPPTDSSRIVTQAADLANTVILQIGGVTAKVAFAGISGSGLYQFNVEIPNVPDGNASVVATIGGASTQTGVVIAVKH